MNPRLPVVVMLALAIDHGVARGQPETASPVSERERLIRTAHDEATAGRCANAALIGERVRKLDAAHHAATVATDEAIASCAALSATQSPTGGALLALAGTLGGIAAGTFILAESEVWGEHGGPRLGVLGGYATAGVVYALGPSLGRLEVDGAWNWWLRLRLIGVGAMVVGAALDFAGVTPRAVDAPPVGLSLGVLGGGLVYTVGMIGELVATPLDAAAHNARIAKPHDFALVPLRTRDGASGIGLVGRF
jgi:hypothetical protein